MLRDAALYSMELPTSKNESVTDQPTAVPVAASGARPFLVSSTRSPLANPRTPIHRLAAAIQSQLYFPDPGPLYAVCGCLAANTLRGYPVWLMLIGPPESGKTELLKPLLGLAGVRECGDLSGKAALLSGTKAKDRAADATGGVLHDMIQGADGKYRGALVMLDFARTVLAADPATTRSTLGSIGMLHDQHWQRDIGTDGGKTISFSGRIGFLAACTDVIDHPDHQQANAEMGERCIYYRYPESDGYHEINSALDNPDGTNKSRDIKQLFLDWEQELGLDWDDLTPPRLLDESEKRLLNALSQLCAKGRSGVQRDKYNRNEITGVSRAALGPRLAGSFAQLLRGLERIGCTVGEMRQTLIKTALDSIPAVRSTTLSILRDSSSGGGGVVGSTIADIALKLRISANSTKRCLEDLQVHDLTYCDRPDGGGRWTLSERASALMATIFEEV